MSCGRFNRRESCGWRVESDKESGRESEFVARGCEVLSYSGKRSRRGRSRNDSEWPGRGVEAERD